MNIRLSDLMNLFSDISVKEALKEAYEIGRQEASKKHDSPNKPDYIEELFQLLDEDEGHTTFTESLQSFFETRGYLTDAQFVPLENYCEQRGLI